MKKEGIEIDRKSVQGPHLAPCDVFSFSLSITEGTLKGRRFETVAGAIKALRVVLENAVKSGF